MKQWIAGHILSTNDLSIEEIIPMSDKEFYVSLSMVFVALTLFGIIVQVLGS
jgi:hypothetical protein